MRRRTRRSSSSPSRYEVIVPIFPGFEESEGLDRSTGWRTRSSTCSTCGRSSGSTRRRSSGCRSAAGWRSSSRPGTRSGSSKLVLVNPVGLYLDEAPMAEMFGRTPGELADMLFADQELPDRRGDAPDGRVRRRRRQGDRDPARVRPADVEGARRDRPARLGPVPAQPEAARPAAAHHRADADRRRRAGRPRADGLRRDVRRRDPRRAPRGDRGRRALVAVREARRAHRARSPATFLVGRRRRSARWADSPPRAAARARPGSPGSRGAGRGGSRGPRRPRRGHGCRNARALRRSWSRVPSGPAMDSSRSA